MGYKYYSHVVQQYFGHRWPHRWLRSINLQTHIQSESDQTRSRRIITGGSERSRSPLDESRKVDACSESTVTAAVRNGKRCSGYFCSWDTPSARPTLCFRGLKLYVRKNSLRSLPLLWPATCSYLSVPLSVSCICNALMLILAVG